MTHRDPSLDTLLDLNGQVLVIDEAGYWVKFGVSQTTSIGCARSGPMSTRTLLAAFWEEVESVMREKGVWI